MICYATKYLIALTLLCWHFRGTWAISCIGCVDLDELNFDRTIVRFPYAIIKFDIAFPYGEKHDAFAEFSKAAHKASDELLVGTVGIKDYGENENKNLGDRFNVNDKSFPGILLFKGNVKDYIQFPAYLEVTLDNLKKFVTENTALFIGRDGCVKQYEQLVKLYANLVPAEQQEVLARGEKLKNELTNESERASAKIYLTFMRKINEKGYNFVDEEMKRLLRLRASKVTTAKKVELMEKLNILESFRVGKLTKVAYDEL